MMVPRVVAGLGCRLGTRADDVTAAIAHALELAGRQPEALARLATSAAKADEPGLRAAAAALGLVLEAVPQEDLLAAAPGCLSHSARVMAETGLPSLAEAAALAAAGPGARLLGPRVALARAVTCALAETRP